MTYIVQSCTVQLWAENIPVVTSICLIPMSLDCHHPPFLLQGVKLISIMLDYEVREHKKGGLDHDVKKCFRPNKTQSAVANRTKNVKQIQSL